PSTSPGRGARVVHETAYTKSGFCRRAEHKVVLPAPDGAERTKRMPVRWKVLFNVGQLFADSIKIGFGLNHKPGNFRIARFGSGRVPFASHFLGDEFERAPHRFLPFQGFPELDEVTLETGQFLGDVAAFGENGDLGQEPGFRQINRKRRRLQSAEQTLPLTL